MFFIAILIGRALLYLPESQWSLLVQRSCRLIILGKHSCFFVSLFCQLLPPAERFHEHL